MGTFEIIAGILLILAGLVIILVVLVQESKEQGLTSAVGGGSNESFYEHNMGKTRDAKLSKFTRNAAIILFIVTLAVNLVSTINNNKDNSAASSGSATTVSSAASEDASSAESTESAESTAAAESTEAPESTEAASTDDAAAE
ncbi:MAG: preprotein translocase subunit SecG [Ruminococcus sp.]|nr:preprotein translocase subunit SecG [Ruminococcus sp.]